LKKVLSVLKFLGVLYLFFLCIELMGGSFKLIGEESARRLLSITDNPLVGLLIGSLATSIMQSSSTTTSIVVGMVAGGTLNIGQAVYIVMGANRGTTITNLIVSLGHIRLRKEFELAFSGSTVHDFFNTCAIIILFPVELIFQPIQRTAIFMSSVLCGAGGTTFNSPLKAIVKPVATFMQDLGRKIIPNDKILGVVLIVVALALLIFALARMVKIMRGAMAKRLEVIVDRYLFTSTFRALIIGMLVTALVQSSSVTTSLVVPLLGTGIVTIEAAFPYMVGANIGTTITAILASLVTGSTGAMTVAWCHLLFNIFGTAIFLPLRRIPIWLAVALGRATFKRRWIALVYVILAFFVIPGILIFLF
jgi:sodium-dependent phosphate cotransporter